MSRFRWYLLRRLAGMVVTAWLVLTIAFVLFTAKPDMNVWLVMFGAGSSAEAQREAVQAYKLAHNYDIPILQRYTKWMINYATMQWGTTLDGIPIADLIGYAIGETAKYLVPSLIVSTVVAYALGLLMAIRKRGLLDRLGTAFAYGGYAIPAFFVAEMTFQILVEHFGMLWLKLDSTMAHEGVIVPASIDQYLLPTIILTIHLIAIQLVFIRSEVTDFLNADFMKTFRASGAAPIDLGRHAIRNALPPLISSFFVQLLTILYLDIIAIEVAIGPNGFGHLTYQAFTNQDIGLILGVALVPIFVGLVGNLAQDITFTMLDPRIELGTSVEGAVLGQLVEDRVPFSVQTIAVVLVAVIVVGGFSAFLGVGGFGYLAGSGPSSVVTTPTPTPERGLDVRIGYSGPWRITLEITVNESTTERTRTGTGNTVIEIDSAASRIRAAVQKRDGSREKLVLQVVRDGELIRSTSTREEYGRVHILINF